MPDNDDIKNEKDNIEQVDETTTADNSSIDETTVQSFTPENFKTETEDKSDDKTVTVQPIQFASFDDLDQVQGPQNQNLNILLDVKLQLSVELGKTDLLEQWNREAVR